MKKIYLIVAVFVAVLFIVGCNEVSQEGIDAEKQLLAEEGISVDDATAIAGQAYQKESPFKYLTCDEGANGVKFTYSISGKERPSKEYTNLCKGDYAVEWSCGKYNRPNAKKINCVADGLTCLDGMCVGQIAVEDPVCVDTDGGDNIFVRGTVTGHWGCVEDALPIVIEIDSCEGTNNLREYTCNAGCNNILARDTECEFGCVDGACLEEPVIEEATVEEAQVVVEEVTETETMATSNPQSVCEQRGYTVFSQYQNLEPLSDNLQYGTNFHATPSVLDSNACFKKLNQEYQEWQSLQASLRDDIMLDKIHLFWDAPYSCVDLYRGMPIIKLEHPSAGNVYQILYIEPGTERESFRVSSRIKSGLPSKHTGLPAASPLCTFGSSYVVLGQDQGFTTVADLKDCIDEAIANKMFDSWSSLLFSIDDDVNCAEEVTPCVDSDNRDYFVKGNLKVTGGSFSYIYPDGVDDICVDATTVGEYYCSHDGTYKYAQKDCTEFGLSYHCENAICVQ